MYAAVYAARRVFIELIENMCGKVCGVQFVIVESEERVSACIPGSSVRAKVKAMGAPRRTAPMPVFI